MTQEPTETEAPDREAIETEARQYGWAGRENWKGDDAHFIDAPEFVRRTKEHLPLVNNLLAKERQRTAELERKQREYDARVDDLNKRLKAQDATHAKMMEIQRTELLQRFEGEKRAALAIEDPARRAAAYDAAARRETDAVRTLAAVEQTPQERSPAVTETAPALNADAKARGDAWIARETWLADPAARAAAQTISVPIDFNSDPEGHLDYVKAEMEKRFPGLTGAEKPNGSGQRQVQAVEGSGSRGGSRAPKTKGFNELPAEAKTACERMISNKMTKAKPEDFKKAYAAQYWKEYGDE